MSNVNTPDVHEEQAQVTIIEEEEILIIEKPENSVAHPSMPSEE